MKPINFKESALLVIDMQNAFVEKGQPLCVNGAMATIPSIMKTADEVRRYGARVIWIRRQYAADGSDMESFRRKKMAERNMLDIMSLEVMGQHL